MEGIQGIFPGEEKTAGLWGGGESSVNELTRERDSDICRALIHVDVWNSQGHVLL